MYNYDYLKQVCHQRRQQIVLGMIRKYTRSASPNILSVGCGGGVIEKEFPGNVQGVDIAVPEETLISVIEGTAEKLPFADNNFDAVFLGEIIEHIYDTHQALSEVKRVLKKEGIAVITVPNVMNLKDRVAALFGKLPRHLSGYLDQNPHLYEHIRHFNKKSLQKVLEKNGFEVLKFSSPAVNINLFGSKPLDLYWLAQFIPSVGNNLICVARLK